MMSDEKGNDTPDQDSRESSTRLGSMWSLSRLTGFLNDKDFIITTFGSIDFNLPLPLELLKYIMLKFKIKLVS